MEQCDHYTAFCVKGRSKLQEAPKDVKILEILKPSGEPNMYARHEAMVSKEKRLEAAARPVVSAKTGGKRKAEEEDVKEDEKKAPTRSKKGNNKKKAPRKVIESDLNNTEALKQDDEVEEGIDWSDDE